MSPADRFRSTYLRIDARSLGLFRIAMGAALIGDWWLRWSDLKAFYSNEGVLQNHAHLYNVTKLDPSGRVWSVLHAFSTPGENAVAFLLALLVYVFFTIGWSTRVFHVLSLAVLVSFTGRDLLIEGPANDVALALLAATAFLPCGSRFSVDSLRASLRGRDEKDATALNDRRAKGDRAIADERSPGWSPTSLAALAVLLQLTIIFVATSRQQSGAGWHDGTALHYALWVERYVSDLGVHVRSAPAGLLSLWTQILRITPLAVPVLLFVPAPRYARLAAFGLTLFYGLSYGLLFSFGLWGWTFVAASFLMLSTESWDAWQSTFRKGRAITVVYDADCGICLWLTRLLKRLDLRGQITFQGNDSFTVPPAAPGSKTPYRTAASDEGTPARLLYRRSKPGAPVEGVPLPAEITDELAAGTVIAVDEKGHVFTEGRAVAAIVRSLPLGEVLSLPLRIPGTAGLWNALYRLVPPRRFAISESLGLAACGVPMAPEPAEEGAAAAAQTPEGVAPAVRLRRAISGLFREVGAVVLLLAALSQTGKSNPWPAAVTLPENRLFDAITGWTRMQARYDVLAPEPPQQDGVLVVDAQTRAGRSIDLMTGKEPVFDPPRFRMGLLWSDYVAQLRKKQIKDISDVERGFRDYLVKGGPAWVPEPQDNQITGFDAYWITYKSPAPGQSGVTLVGREKLFTHSRGGRGAPPMPAPNSPPIR